MTVADPWWYAVCRLGTPAGLPRPHGVGSARTCLSLTDGGRGVTFDDLPEVPEGFSIGELPKPAPRIAPVAFLAAWSIRKTSGTSGPYRGR